VSLAVPAPDQAIVLIGATRGWLGATLYLRELLGREDGAPPPVDLDAERRNGDLVRGLIGDGLVGACHDLSDGGLLVAVAEMALAGGIGAALEPAAAGDLPDHAFWFGEDQGRYLVTAADPAAVLARATAAGVPAAEIGRTGGDSLTLGDTAAISLGTLRTAHEGWLPAYMGS
jgi:phosphoribosylformylglycinamidine synthase